MKPRVTLFNSCLWDHHTDCHVWLPDPCPDDPEEPSQVVCGCECHEPPVVAVRGSG